MTTSLSGARHPALSVCPDLAALIAGLLLLALPHFALAQDSGAKPLWEVGAGVFATSQQAYPGSAEHVRRALPFPYLIYRGALLRADRSGLGLVALRTPTFEVDLGVAGAFGSGSAGAGARAGMPGVGTLIEAGPRLKWKLSPPSSDGQLRAEFALRGVFDLSDRLRYQGLSFEPKMVYENDRGLWHYSSSAGVVLADRRLSSVFYGVTPPFATANRPAYEAQAGLVAWRLAGTVSRHVTPQWRVFGFARIDALAGAANRASPLVQRSSGTTVGLGLVYTWAQSTTLVSY